MSAGEDISEGSFWVDMRDEKWFPELPVKMQTAITVRSLSEEIGSLKQTLREAVEIECGPAFRYEEFTASAALAADPRNRGAWDGMFDMLTTERPTELGCWMRSSWVDACISIARAEHAAQASKIEVAWYHVARACRAMGRAEGLLEAIRDREMKESRSSKGVEARWGDYDQVKRRCIELLREKGVRPEKGWKTKAKAIVALGDKLSVFIDESKLRVDGDLYERVRVWLSSDEAVIAAFNANRCHV